MDGPPLPSQAGWPALLPRHPPTLPLPRFIPCCLWCPESNQCPGPAEHSDYLCSIDGWVFGELRQWSPACSCPPSTLPNLSHLLGIRGGASLPVLGVRGRWGREPTAPLPGTTAGAVTGEGSPWLPLPSREPGAEAHRATRQLAWGPVPPLCPGNGSIPLSHPQSIPPTPWHLCTQLKP